MTQSNKPVQDDTGNDQAKKPEETSIEDAEIVEESAGPDQGDLPGSGDPAAPDGETAETVEDEPEADAEGGDEAETPPRSEPEAEPETADAGQSEPAAPPLAPQPVEVPRVSRGPGFMTLLLGGVAAGAIGYFAAFSTQFRPFAEMFGFQDPQAAVSALEQRLDEVSAQASEAAAAAADAGGSAETAASTAETAVAQAGEASSGVSALAERLDELQATVEGLTPGVDDIPPAVVEALRSATADEVNALSDRVAAAEETLAGLSSAAEDLAALEETVAENAGTLSGLSESFAAIESKLEGVAGIDTGALDAAIAGFRNELDTLQQQLEAQAAAVAEAEAKAAEMQAAAAAQQRAVLAEAALARVRAAIEGGGSYAGALADFESASDMDVPEVISANAESGVMSLRDLQESFPDAARDALDKALAAEAGTGSAVDRLGKFLRSQSGARSLSEREGNDPDAVLSRAEARLNEGRLDAALAELAGLNEAGQAAMAGWVANAQTRLDAQAAVSDMTAALGSE